METTDATSTTHPVQVVRRYYRLVDRGDVDGLVDLFAPDAVYERPGYPPLRGRAALRAFYRGERVIESGAHVLDGVLHAAAGTRTGVNGDGLGDVAGDGPGDAVAVQGRFTGRLRDGREVDLRFADFFRLDATGLIARRDTYFFAPLV